MKDMPTKPARQPCFSLGGVVATPGVLAAFAATGERITRCLAQHQCGEWGQLDPADVRANEEALRCGARVFSAYQLTDGTKIYIITEADRKHTCVLLPSEY